MWCLQNKEDEWKWNPMFSTGLVALIHFSRGPAPCQDHTSKGTGESVFPGSSTDVLHFLYRFMCCFLGACQTGKWSEEECGSHLPSEPPWEPWDKACGRVGTWEGGVSSCPAESRTCTYMTGFAGSYSIVFVFFFSFLFFLNDKPWFNDIILRASSIFCFSSVGVKTHSLNSYR